MNDTNDTRK